MSIVLLKGLSDLNLFSKHLFKFAVKRFELVTKFEKYTQTSPSTNIPNTIKIVIYSIILSSTMAKSYRINRARLHILLVCPKTNVPLLVICFLFISTAALLQYLEIIASCCLLLLSMHQLHTQLSFGLWVSSFAFAFVLCVIIKLFAHIFALQTREIKSETKGGGKRRLAIRIRCLVDSGLASARQKKGRHCLRKTHKRGD